MDWSLRELTSFLIKENQLEEPYRLRNLTTNRLFVKEELETPLRSYPDFLEGGARVTLEEGRYPTIEELAIKVALYKEEDDYK